MGHLRGFRLLHLRQLVIHPGRTVALGLGIAVVAAMITILAEVNASMVGSVEAFGRLAGRADIQLSAVDLGGFDDAITSRVAAEPGVRAAIPAVLTHIPLRGRDALLVGVEAGAAALGGSLGQQVDRELNASGRNPNDYLGGVFLGRNLASSVGVRTGDSIDFAAAPGGRLRILGVIDGGESGDANDGYFVVGLLKLAQELSGRPNRIDAVLVLADGQADQGALSRRLAAVAGPSAQVSSPRVAADAASRVLDPLRQLLAVVTGLVLALAVLLLFGVLSIDSQERRSDVSRARLIGQLRSALVVGLMVEVLLLSAASSVAGALAGLVVAPSLVSGIPPYYDAALGARVAYHFSFAAPLIAVLATTFAALVGAALPALAIARAEPLEAVTSDRTLESTAERPRSGRDVAWAIAGVAAVATALVLTFVVGARRTLPGTVTLLLMGGFAVVAWETRGPMALATRAVLGRLGVAGTLAGDALAAAPRRGWGLLMVVVMSTAVVIAVAGLNSDTSSAIARLLAPQREAGLVAQAAPPSGLSTALELPAWWAAELAAIPGVTSVAVERYRFVDSDGQRVLVAGFGAGTHDPVLRLASPRAQADVIAGRGVIVTGAFSRAHALGSAAGAVTLARGQEPEPVVEVVDFPAVTQAGEVAVSLASFSAAYGPGGAGRLEVDVAPAQSAAVRDRIISLAAAAGLPVSVVTGSELATAEAGILAQVGALFGLLAWTAAVAGAMAGACFTWLAVANRSREIRLLRVIGASRRQVLGMVVLEVVAVGAVGGLLGAATGSVLRQAGAGDLENLVGLIVTPGPWLPVALLSVAVAALIAALCSLPPAVHAAALEV